MCAERMPNPDVLIVGSGIAGVLIARQLGRAGKKVLILEAGEALPPDINGYMNTFLGAKDKVPESPYPPALFAGKDLSNPGNVNAGSGLVDVCLDSSNACAQPLAAPQGFDGGGGAVA